MIPLSVRDLTLTQFTEFQKVVKNNSTTDIISAITGLSKEDIDNIPLKELKNINTRIGFLLSDYIDLTEGVGKIKVNKYCFHKWKLYKAVTDSEKLNANQYTSIKTFNPETQLHDMLSMIYIPFKIRNKVKHSRGYKTHWFSFTFNPDLTKDIANDFKSIKCSKVLGLVFFYSRKSKKQKADLQASLIQAKLNLIVKLAEAEVPQEVLDKIMDGITS